MSLNLRIYIPCQESSQQTLCHESKLEFQKIEAVQVWLQPDEWILQSVIFNEEIEASKELLHFSIFPASQQFLYILVIKFRRDNIVVTGPVRTRNTLLSTLTDFNLLFIPL